MKEVEKLVWEDNQFEKGQNLSKQYLVRHFPWSEQNLEKQLDLNQLTKKNLSTMPQRKRVKCVVQMHLEIWLKSTNESVATVKNG